MITKMSSGRQTARQKDSGRRARISHGRSERSSIRRTGQEENENPLEGGLDLCSVVRERTRVPVCAHLSSCAIPLVCGLGRVLAALVLLALARRGLRVGLGEGVGGLRPLFALHEPLDVSLGAE